MPTNGVGMEGNIDDIDELSGNQLQTCKRRRSADGFAYDEHIVLDRDEGVAQRCTIIMIDLG